MYCNFFGLKRRPFDDQPDPELFCPTSTHDEVLAAMDYDAQHGTGVSLVVAEAGLGKSILARTLERRLAPTHSVVSVTCVTGARFDLLATIAKKLDAARGQTRSRTRMVGRIQRVLARVTGSRGAVILIVDQAERLMESDVRSLAMLTESEAHGDRLIQLFLVGQPRTQKLLQQSGLESFRQRAVGVRTLTAMTLEDTQAYVSGRLGRAGCPEPEAVFVAEAIEPIHRRSGGNPRLVNRICDAALVHAYGSGEKTVTKAILDEACANMTADEGHAGETTAAPSHATVGAGDSRQAPGSAHRAPRSAAVLDSHESSLEDVAVSVAGAPTSFPGADVVHRGELLARQVEEMLGRGAAHLRRQESSARSTELLMGSAEAVIERLERTIQHAESCHALRDRWGEDREQIERRIDGKVERAYGALETLEQKTLDIDESVEQFDQRLNALTERYERRIAELENRLAERLAEATPVTERIEELDEACRRAAQIEGRLGAFAQKLLESGENAQQRIAHLMTALTAGEEVIEQLGGATQTAREAVECCRTEVAEQAQRLTDAVTAVATFERSHAELLDRATTLAEQARTATSLLDTAEHKSSELRRRLEADSDELRAQSQSVDDLDERVLRLEAQRQAVASTTDELTARLSDAKAIVDDMTDAVNTDQARAATICASLKETVESGADRAKSIEWKLDECRSRADKIGADVDAATRRGDATVAEIRESVGCAESIHHTVANCLINIGSACERIDDAKREVAALGRTLDRIDAARGQCDEIIERFDGVDCRFEDITRRFDGIRTATEQMQHTVEQLDEIRTVSDQTERLLEAMQAERQQTDESCRAAVAARRTVDERLAELQRRFESLTGGLESSLAAAARELERCDLLHDLIGDARQMREALTVEVGQANQKLEALGSHVAAASDVTRTLSDSTRKAHSLLEKTQAASQAAAESLTRAEDIEARLHAVVEAHTGSAEHADQLVATLRAATEEANACRHELTDSVTRLSAEADSARRELAAEREAGQAATHAVREAGDRLRGLMAESTRAVELSAARREELAALVETLEPLVNRVEAARDVAIRQADQLRIAATEADQRIGEHRVTIERVCAQAEANRQVVAQVEHAFATVKKLAESAGEQQTQLRNAHEHAAETLARLEHALGRAEPNVEKLDQHARQVQRLAAIQQEQSARCESVAATLETRTREATDVDTALGKRLQDCTATIDRRARESAAAIDARVGQAREQIEKLIADAWEVGNSTKTRTDQMILTGEAVEPLERSLQSTVAKAKEAVATLHKENETAVTSRESLSAQRREALEIAERLKATIGVLRTAQGMSKSLKDAIEGAGEAAERATGAAHEARHAAETLESQCEEASRVLKAQQEARAEASTVVDRMSQLCQGGRDVIASMADSQRFNESMVAELERRFNEGSSLVTRADDLLRRIDERDMSMDAADRMLREFMTQAEELAARMTATQKDVRSLQSEVTHAMGGPTSIVEEARNQATQLENVCRAVRKVFTALSKTTLEANEKTTEFSRIATGADERLRQLLTETDRTAATLQQWVEEAVRAQSRLDQTLARTPGIGATHPTASVERTAESLRRSVKPGDWNTPRPGGDGQRASAPGRSMQEAPTSRATTAGLARSSTPVDAPRTVAPQSRVDEITAMIEDARRATAELKA